MKLQLRECRSTRSALCERPLTHRIIPEVKHARYSHSVIVFARVHARQYLHYRWPPISVVLFDFVLTLARSVPVSAFGASFTLSATRPWHIGLSPHTYTRTPTTSPGAASFILTMESREGRAGNAFACQRCRQHKVRCVPSDTTGICQRYLCFSAYFVILHRMTRAQVPESARRMYRTCRTQKTSKGA
jgi:hypothetical protein